MKRKISAREAVVDIRSGKSDAELMDKYRLSATGLQSLFDKLVSAGYLDLSEIQRRIASFVGTVVIPQPDLHQEKDAFATGGEADSKAKRIVINAQEAARDIRSRMSDSAIMEKHRLSARGLQSIFDKLMTLGVITQDDLDQRGLDEDHTIDLKEQMPTFSQELAPWERSEKSGARSLEAAGIEEITPPETAKGNADKMLQSNLGQRTEPHGVLASDTITGGSAQQLSTTLIIAIACLMLLCMVLGFLACLWTR